MIRYRRRSFILATELLLLAAGLFSCSSKRDQNEDFRQEVETLEKKTVPPEAKVLARSGPVRSDWSVTASWEIETTLGRAEYSKWVVSQLQPEFKVVRGDETQLSLSRHEDNDTHSVECRFSRLNDKLRVRVAFSARPD